MDFKSEQLTICRKYNAPFVESNLSMKVGISLNVRDGILPINGLRHPIEGDTSGWYIWAGEEFSEDPNFFVPLHILHIQEWCPIVIKFLALAPGWRFLVTPDYEDVWEDSNLLEV